MARPLSRPVADLKPSYDVVVVGSGYGGGVAASRLARCGRSVAVLERGREYLPGDFPRGPLEASRALRVEGQGTSLGSPDALFQIRIGNGIHVLHACAVGGTSLINANVCLTPDERIFDAPVWPRELTSDRVLAEGYLRSRAMLRPAPQPGWQEWRKVRAFDTACSVLGRRLVPTPIHVAFEAGSNAAGIEQPACTACGDCCGGCNIGAKTTVANTYLADAVAHGAEIFCGAHVRSLAREPDGRWRIKLAAFGVPDEVACPDLSASIAVVAAGTLGSTEILMRSAAEGLALSDRLGERFTSNGDAIAIAYNNAIPVNGIGIGHPPKVNVPPVGAAVNALLDLRNTDAVRDGLAIVECALPSSLAPLLPSLLAAGSTVFGEDGQHKLLDELAEVARSTKSLFGGAYSGAVHHTQTFLAVGHDEGDGQMRLEGGRITVDWSSAARQPVFARIEDLLRRLAHATGGTYMRNPAAERLFGGNALTVHPLGGCIMGADRRSGVVNHKGQVFDGRSTEPADAVYKGLYVSDGSVIPCSLGVHPLLTICALAERAMLHLAHDYGWEMSEGPPPPAAPNAMLQQTVAARRRGWLGWRSG